MEQYLDLNVFVAVGCKYVGLHFLLVPSAPTQCPGLLRGFLLARDLVIW
jgi:hypothetical protein